MIGVNYFFRSTTTTLAGHDLGGGHQRRPRRSPRSRVRERPRSSLRFQVNLSLYLAKFSSLSPRFPCCLWRVSFGAHRGSFPPRRDVFALTILVLSFGVVVVSPGSCRSGSCRSGSCRRLFVASRPALPPGIPRTLLRFSLLILFSLSESSPPWSEVLVHAPGGDQAAGMDLARLARAGSPRRMSATCPPSGRRLPPSAPGPRSAPRPPCGAASPLRCGCWAL